MVRFEDQVGGVKTRSALHTSGSDEQGKGKLP
jgi:hypothetical protein